MLSLLWPVVMIVAANTVYNICTKSTPANINAFASLALTYLVAGAASLALFFCTRQQEQLAAELGKANWTSVVLGLAVVALEFGYIAAFRAGWHVSVCSIVANISLACVLLAVGTLLYKESVSLQQLAGVAVCALGLYLISR